MSWIPYAFREKRPCTNCGTQSYIAEVIGDCSWTQGKVFCSDTCKTTYRWRHKFKIYEHRDKQHHQMSDPFSLRWHRQMG